jgi:hypothetical protein
MTIDHLVDIAVALLQFGASVLALASVLPRRRGGGDSGPKL